MDIKSIVLGEITKQVESSIPQLSEGIESLIIDKIQSEEFEKEWATAINKKVNLPFLNEQQEQELLESIIDKGTDIVASVMKKLLSGK